MRATVAPRPGPARVQRLESTAPEPAAGPWFLGAGIVGWLAVALVRDALGPPVARDPLAPAGASERHEAPRLEDLSPRELRSIPGIGERRAVAIASAAWASGARAPGGGPLRVEEVHGVGPRSAERIAAWLAGHAGSGAVGAAAVRADAAPEAEGALGRPTGSSARARSAPASSTAPPPSSTASPTSSAATPPSSAATPVSSVATPASTTATRASTTATPASNAATPASNGAPAASNGAGKNCSGAVSASAAERRLAGRPP